MMRSSGSQRARGGRPPGLSGDDGGVVAAGVNLAGDAVPVAAVLGGFPEALGRQVGVDVDYAHGVRPVVGVLGHVAFEEFDADVVGGPDEGELDAGAELDGFDEELGALGFHGGDGLLEIFDAEAEMVEAVVGFLDAVGDGSFIGWASDEDHEAVEVEVDAVGAAIAGGADDGCAEHVLVPLAGGFGVGAA